jgi:Uma2 family endonuclease
MPEVSYDEYLRLEEPSETRHEYLDGEIHAIPQATPDHAALAATLISLVGQQLQRGCRGFTSNLRVRIPAADMAFYPDVTIICGDLVMAPDDPIAVTNPQALIEVTSDSTDDYDRGVKLTHYKTIPSLREVLIASHREPRLTMHRRDASGTWIVEEARSGESIRLESIGAVLKVDDIYRDPLEDLR